MLERVVLFAGIGLFWAAQAQSQDLSDRAGSAVSGLGAITDMLTQDNIDEAVVPFETANPDEVNLDPNQFDDHEVLILQSDGIEGRALSSTVESFGSRPDIDLGEDPLALADDAVEQSEAVAGGLFSQAGGECSATFEGGEFSGEQLCRAIVGRDTNSCLETRSIAVDREDHWECDIETGTYDTSCLKPVQYACTGTTGGLCRQSAVTFTGQGTAWSSSDTLATVDLAASVGNEFGLCNIVVETFEIEVTNALQLTNLTLSSLTIQGAALVKVNDAVVAVFDSNGAVVPNIIRGGVTYSPLELVHNFISPNVFAPYFMINPNAGQPGEPDHFGIQETADLGACNDTSKIVTADVDLMPLISPQTQPYWTVESDNLQEQAGSGNQTLTVTVQRANFVETAPPKVRFSVNGGCCSQITASGGGQC